MKRLIAALLLALVLPSGVEALETRDLVALAAMPLAVAAVAELADVPTTDLMQVVSAMNRAAVPPPQFVEVVRYVPVALVDDTEPRFVTYVTTRADEGLTGQAFALALQDRINTYGVTDIDVVAPRVVAVDDDFFPPVVVSRFEPVRFDPVALVAMPLAVAAVAELTDVPSSDLFSFISLLNQAAVPPRQFVEVVRYVPVALVADDDAFLTFATTEYERGVMGNRYAATLADRIRLFGVREINVVDPPLIVERSEFIPTIVTTRIVETRKGHPHGGPPGQLKKERGLQTGAEVVFGTRPGRIGDDSRRRPVVRDDDRDERTKVKVKVKADRQNDGEKKRDRVKIERKTESAPAPAVDRRSHGGEHEKGGKPGKAKGKGKG